MAENISNLVNDSSFPIQRAKKDPKKVMLEKSIPKHIIIRHVKTKNKEQVLKAVRETHDFWDHQFQLHQIFHLKL